MSFLLVMIACIAVGCVIRRKRLGASGGTQTRRQDPVNQPNEIGPMVYFANDRHGQPDREYRFNYKRVNGGWRAYILKMPSLQRRDSSSGVTHRQWENGKAYICWGSKVTSLRDMQNISRAWADNIQEYIATGKRFG